MGLSNRGIEKNRPKGQALWTNPFDPGSLPAKN